MIFSGDRVVSNGMEKKINLALMSHAIQTTILKTRGGDVSPTPTPRFSVFSINHKGSRQKKSSIFSGPTIKRGGGGLGPDH